jgi:endoglucanase
MNSETKMKRVLQFAVLFLALATYLCINVQTKLAKADAAVQVWWPTNGAHVAGTQPLKAMYPGTDVSGYEMFWQVDGGTWNWMDNNYADYQHKEAKIDVSGWNWRGNGPYTINFIARKNGIVVSQQSVQVYVDNGTFTTAPAQTSTAFQATPTVQATPFATASVQNFSGTVQTSSVQNTTTSTSNSKLYVDPNSSAAKQAANWASSNPNGARAMQVLASQPTASWFGNWNNNVQNDVHTIVAQAQAQGSMPVLVAYDIPGRDCGGYSSGGTNSPSGYIDWVRAFAAGIGSAPATVLLEPDALAQMSCLSGNDQATRVNLLSQAVQILKQNGNTKVYLDAGHSGWVDAGTMADRLSRAGVASADGFALNISNFSPTNDEVSYGTSISQKVGNKHFVVDTSRNGNGSNGEWCNPWGRAIGNKPTTSTGNSLVDAYLWVKTPGESDGNCNGGPSAGNWWPSYAQTLVENAH